MPTLEIFIRNFSGTTRILVEGDHHHRRDVTAYGYSIITADLMFQPDHIWFWVDLQDGDDYKANIEIKWVERNLVLYRLINPDGVKGEMAKVSSPHFKGIIDSLPPQVRNDTAGRLKTDAIYHVDDFAY
jgi:hypothetical protein